MRGMNEGDAMEYERTMTEDGTPTFWHAGYREHYHSRHGALQEANLKFVRPSGLAQRLQAGGRIDLLDVCFGLSYNSFAAAALAREGGGGASLEITALEIDRGVVAAAVTALAGTLPAWWLELVGEAIAQGRAACGPVALVFNWGDARSTLAALPEGSADLLYHDPFSTQRTPQLWSVDFFRQARRVLRPDGALLTYSQSGAVRSGLMAAGFDVGHTCCEGTMRDGSCAVPRGGRLATPLTAAELAALAMPKGEPYRDPDLLLPAAAILRERESRIEARRND
jgi:tRNA U34 5-methylaminomethyl-2-thiouridine-forming methyltransferase MnmC